jgi:hypothetical protein
MNANTASNEGSAIEKFVRTMQELDARRYAGCTRYTVHCSYKGAERTEEVYLRPAAWENPGEVARQKAAKKFKRHQDLHPCTTRIKTEIVKTETV